MPIGDTPENRNVSTCRARTSPGNGKSTRTALTAAKRACGDGTDAPGFQNRSVSVAFFADAVTVEHDH